MTKAGAAHRTAWRVIELECEQSVERLVRKVPLGKRFVDEDHPLRALYVRTRKPPASNQAHTHGGEVVEGHYVHFALEGPAPVFLTHLCSPSSIRRSVGKAIGV